MNDMLARATVAVTERRGWALRLARVVVPSVGNPLPRENRVGQRVDAERAVAPAVGEPLPRENRVGQRVDAERAVAPAIGEPLPRENRVGRRVDAERAVEPAVGEPLPRENRVGQRVDAERAVAPDVGEPLPRESRVGERVDAERAVEPAVGEPLPRENRVGQRVDAERAVAPAVGEPLPRESRVGQRVDAERAVALSVGEPLLPILALVFVTFFVVGLALPVIPLHVHEGLGLSTFVVGLVAGSQFAAALVSRLWAGHHSDGRGPKRAVLAGLLLATGAGMLYLVSLRFVGAPATSVTILLLARALLGAAESFIVTGSLSWGLTLAGAQNTGKVMAWVGTAMYAAYAIAAPVGSALYSGHGFAAIALVTMLAPLGALLLVALLPPVAPLPHVRPALSTVVGAVWMPGVGLAFSCVGFGAITTFIALLFAEHGWGSAWPAFTALSVSFITARLILGHLPDRIGGGKVALGCVLLEAAGLAMIWLAPGSALVLAGAAVSGFGYSLVFPAFGVEAVRCAPPQSRGLAMGVYSAFLDLSLGITSPALGWIAGGAGVGAVFLASGLVVLCAAAVAMRILHGGGRGQVSHLTR